MPQIVNRTPTMRTRMAGLRQRKLAFTNRSAHEVPVLLTLPPASEPRGTALLVHGFASDKDGISRQMARVLADRGIASLAPDLPCHGERPGTPEGLFSLSRPEDAYRNVVEAALDLRQTIDAAQCIAELNGRRGITLIGYSMGAWIGTLAAACDERITALVLMVAGSATATATRREQEGPGIPERLDLIHRYPTLRHDVAVSHCAPQPILFQNGRHDELVPQTRAEALFAAAREPKEMRWYDAGHLLGMRAYREAGDWTLDRLEERESD